MEVCCTLGMLTDDQARRLADAGLTAYNHNLDTSPEFYGEIITTRRYDDRLRTIAAVRRAGITVCCGGIIGMGESDEDRIGLLHQLATLDPHPESVPINMLVRVEGTPLGDMRAGRSAHAGAHDRHGAPADARFHGAPQRWPPFADARSRRAVLPRRSQFHLRRRKTAHHAQSRARRRRPPLPRSRPASRSSHANSQRRDHAS